MGQKICLSAIPAAGDKTWAHSNGSFNFMQDLRRKQGFVSKKPSGEEKSRVVFPLSLSLSLFFSTNTLSLSSLFLLYMYLTHSLFSLSLSFSHTHSLSCCYSVTHFHSLFCSFACPLSLSLSFILSLFFRSKWKEKQFCCVCASSFPRGCWQPKSLSISQNVEWSRPKGERKERESENGWQWEIWKECVRERERVREGWEIMVLRPNKFYLFKETASDAMPRFRHLFWKRMIAICAFITAREKNRLSDFQIPFFPLPFHFGLRLDCYLSTSLSISVFFLVFISNLCVCS